MKIIFAVAAVTLLICFSGCRKHEKTADGPVDVSFVSANERCGSVSGYTAQTIQPGEKSKRVVAYPADNFVFTGWSDGVKEAERSGETFPESTTVTANFAFKQVGLPVIEISLEGGDEIKSKTQYSRIGLTVRNENGETELEDASAQLRGRGNATWKLMEKKSYKLKLGEKENLLDTGRGKAKDWVLLANHCDQSLIRNQVAFNLARSLDGLEFTTGCRQVEVLINGVYKGVYLLCEQMEVNESRVNIEVDPEKPDTGYLVELDEYADDDEGAKENETYVVAGGKMFSLKSDVTKNQAQYIKGYLQTVHDAIMSGDQALISRYVDLDSCIDAYLVEEFVLNIDVGWSSFYFYKKPGDDRLYFGPLWDFDLAIGNDKRLFSGGHEGYYVGDDSSDFTQRSIWYGELMNHGWFKKMVRARWEEKKALFEDAYRYAAQCVKEIETAANRNFDTWESLGTRINQEPDHIVNMLTYEKHAQHAISWLQNRYKWLNAYFSETLPK